MAKYKNLSEMPVQICETGYSQFSPLHTAIELLEKMEDRDWYIAHCDQSVGIVENIKRNIEILSDGRIQFIK